nr:nuclear receptor 2C2-associated protein isoform X1 [Anas platyrhynchos]
MLFGGPQRCHRVPNALGVPISPGGPQCCSGVPSHSRLPPLLLGTPHRVPQPCPGAPNFLQVPPAADPDPVSPHAAMPAEPLICADTATRVSSVLNRDVKQFGKQHMFDANEETCWNSDQGARQWVTVDFPRTVRVSQLHIQFQGGFSSRLCTLEGCRTGEELVKISELYPEDVNAMQRFEVEETALDKLKITFENSTDFFGRIVVYHLRVLGERL